MYFNCPDKTRKHDYLLVLTKGSTHICVMTSLARMKTCDCGSGALCMASEPKQIRNVQEAVCRLLRDVLRYMRCFFR